MISIWLFLQEHNTKHELERQFLAALFVTVSDAHTASDLCELVLGVSTLPALTIYCRIVLGSLMTDLGKARRAETNFPIARYKEAEWGRVSRKGFHIIRNNRG